MASLVLLSLQFLSQTLFANGGSLSVTLPATPLLTAASHIRASAAELSSPAETDGRFILEGLSEPTPRSGAFLAAKEAVRGSPRGFIVRTIFGGLILAPKVSRYLSKSVLNI